LPAAKGLTQLRSGQRGEGPDIRRSPENARQPGIRTSAQRTTVMLVDHRYPIARRNAQPSVAAAVHR
jgi:hypothetical protein